MKPLPLLIVGIGGAFGSICRYLAQVCIGRHTTPTFPVGTLALNLTGCFLIGIFFGFSTRYAWMTIEWRLFLITGICGGYTTFSSYSLDAITLLRQGSYTYFFVYVLGSVIGGILLTIAGAAIAR
jgi:CrcB protein